MKDTNNQPINEINDENIYDIPNNIEFEESSSHDQVNSNEVLPEKKRPFWISALIVILGMSIAFSFGLLLRSKIFTTAIVQQSSMVPTLHDGDKIRILRNSNPDQFDVIVFLDEDIHENWLVKRIIATENQQIEIKDGLLYITEDDETIVYEENYIKDANITLPLTTVPDNHYFVLGDNRLTSLDSQEFGAIDKNTLIGRVLFIDSEKPTIVTP